MFSLERGTLIFDHFDWAEKKERFDVGELSPDGRWLAHGLGSEAAIYVCDLHSSRALTAPVILRPHRGGLADLAFSPDGKHLVSASNDGTALVWDMGAIARRGPLARGPGGFGRLWADLADDGEVADRAMADLKRFPDRALPLLEPRLRPVAGAPARKRLDRLIADLDDREYPVRERAEKELAKLADLAEDALRAALRKKLPLEQTRRVERLLTKLDVLETAPERLRVLRAIEVLERIGSAEAVRVLEALAKGAPSSRLTREAKASLERLQTR